MQWMSKSGGAYRIRYFWIAAPLSLFLHGLAIVLLIFVSHYVVNEALLQAHHDEILLAQKKKIRLRWVPVREVLPEVKPSDPAIPKQEARGRFYHPSQSIMVAGTTPADSPNTARNPSTELQAREQALEALREKIAKVQPKAFVPPPAREPVVRQNREMESPMALAVRSSQPVLEPSLARLPKPVPKKFPSPVNEARVPKAVVGISEAPIVLNPNSAIPSSPPLPVDSNLTKIPRRRLDDQALMQMGSQRNSRPSVELEAPPDIARPGANAAALAAAPGGGALGPRSIPRRSFNAETLAQTLGSNKGQSSAKGSDAFAGAPALNSASAGAQPGFSPSAPALPGPSKQAGGGYSQAREVWEPRLVNPGEGAKIVLPGVSVANNTATPSAPSLPPGAVLLRSDSWRSRPSASTPLFPNARRLPMTVERWFSQRPVYSVVVPFSRLVFRRYNGDWVIWFAPSDGAEVTARSVRPPVPLEKVEDGAYIVPSGEQGQLRMVQVGTRIDANGALGELTFARAFGSEVEALVRKDLAAWKFLPATRGDLPTPVDVLLEIPYYLPLTLATDRPKP